MHMFISPPPSFFLENTHIVAQLLLGAYLIHEENHYITGGKIIETEAYVETDAASHSYRGKQHANQSMFLSGGHIYMYRIYGIHECVNIVTAQINQGEAVLIRALEPVFGKPQMIQRRKNNMYITNGPSRLVQALGICKEQHDGTCAIKGSLRILLPRQQNCTQIYHMQARKRVGIRKNKTLFWRYMLSS